MAESRLIPRVGLLALVLLATVAAGAPTPTRSRPARPAPALDLGNPGNVFGSYLAGRFAGDEQDTRAAADALLGALRAEPDQRELLERAFLASVMDGRADALRLARRLPDNMLAQLVQFGADATGGRWDRAEQRARALPRQGAIQALQRALVAWSLAGRGQFDAALAHLRPLAESGRFRALNALHAALIADLAGRGREAERYVRLALADQPEPTLRLALLSASILHRNGRVAEAARILDRLAESHDELAIAALEPARSVSLLNRGIATPAEGIAEALVALGSALRGQDLDDMPMLFGRLAVRVRPVFAPALLLLGDLLTEADQTGAALEALGAIPPNDPLAATAALRRAGLLDRADRLADAEALIRQVAEALPTLPQPMMRLGDILRRRGRFAEAATAYDAAIDRLGDARPHDWPLLYARGIARERSGNWPGAEADFEQALRLAPDQPFVLNYLGYTWAEQGVNLPRARAMLERAVALRPQDGNIADSLGWVLFRTGDLASAILWLEKAVELESRNVTVNDHLGDAYWAAGRETEARFQWRRALAMEPEPADAARIEAKLRDGLTLPARN